MRNQLTGAADLLEQLDFSVKRCTNNDEIFQLNVFCPSILVEDTVAEITKLLRGYNLAVHKMPNMDSIIIIPKPIVNGNV